MNTNLGTVAPPGRLPTLVLKSSLWTVVGSFKVILSEIEVGILAWAAYSKWARPIALSKCMINMTSLNCAVSHSWGKIRFVLPTATAHCVTFLKSLLVVTPRSSVYPTLLNSWGATWLRCLAIIYPWVIKWSQFLVFSAISSPNDRALMVSRSLCNRLFLWLSKLFRHRWINNTRIWLPNLGDRWILETAKVPTMNLDTCQRGLCSIYPHTESVAVKIARNPSRASGRERGDMPARATAAYGLPSQRPSENPGSTFRLDRDVHSMSRIVQEWQQICRMSFSNAKSVPNLAE